MDQIIAERVKRAKQLLATAHNAAMATVNDDGSPHNTPLFLIHDDQLEYLYWISFPATRHCQNALRTDQVFIVLYEANAGGGLYVAAAAVQELDVQNLADGLAAYNQQRARAAKAPLPADDLLQAGGQRLFRTRPVKWYVNYSKKDAAGKPTGDYRYEIKRQDLIS